MRGMRVVAGGAASTRSRAIRIHRRIVPPMASRGAVAPPPTSATGAACGSTNSAPAIDRNGGTSHKGGIVAHQECDGGGDLLWLGVRAIGIVAAAAARAAFGSGPRLAKSASMIGVSTGPGQMQLIRMASPT
jgi:hypothetical protein